MTESIKSGSSIASKVESDSSGIIASRVESTNHDESSGIIASEIDHKLTNHDDSSGNIASQFEPTNHDESSKSTVESTNDVYNQDDEDNSPTPKVPRTAKLKSTDSMVIDEIDANLASIALQRLETGSIDAPSSESGSDTEDEGVPIKSPKISPTSPIKPRMTSPQMQQLYNCFQIMYKKLYFCGFVYKRNELGANGRPLKPTDNVGHGGQVDRGGEWSKWWVELWGPIMQCWRCPDELASFPYSAGLEPDQFISNEIDPPLSLVTAIKSFHRAPIYINVTDSFTQVFNSRFSPKGISPPPPYTNFFCMSNVGSNLYLFATWSAIQANTWVAAIRLVIFEIQKLHTTFTWRILKSPFLISAWHHFGIEPNFTQSFREDIEYEGTLQLRSAYTTQWKEFYVVCTSKYVAIDSFAPSSFNIFGKKQASEEDYSKRGTLLFFASKKDKKKAPLFVIEQVSSIQIIWPEKPELVEMNLLSLAQLQGVMCFPNQKKSDVERTFEYYEGGFPQIGSDDSFFNLIQGKDCRPLPSRFMILTTSSSELAKWTTAILGSFSIDSDTHEDESVLYEMDHPTDVPWPTPLYFSIQEVSGISMDTTQEEALVFFRHYLGQKSSFSKRSKLLTWSEAIANGELERKIIDRKEMDKKIKQLYDWVRKTRLQLTKRDIKVVDPNAEKLVEEISAKMPFFHDALVSMIGAPYGESSSSESVSESGESKVSSKPKEITSSDGEGSVSEDFDTSEGSQSEEEETSGSEKVTTKEPAKYQSETESETDEDEDEGDDESKKNANIYLKNSLLEQLANEGPKKTAVTSGVLINAVASNLNKISGNIRNNSLLAKIQEKGHEEVRLFEGSGPLLGEIIPDAHKPKLEEGLLGQVNRREREKELLKKGQITQEQAMQQEIEYERAKERQRMHERGELHPLDVAQQLVEALTQVNMTPQMNQTITNSLLPILNQVVMTKFRNSRVSTMQRFSFMNPMSMNSQIHMSPVSEGTPIMMGFNQLNGMAPSMNPMANQMLNPMNGGMNLMNYARPLSTSERSLGISSKSSFSNLSRKKVETSSEEESSYATESSSESSASTESTENENRETSEGTEEEEDDDESGSSSETSESESSEDEDLPLMAIARNSRSNRATPTPQRPEPLISPPQRFLPTHGLLATRYNPGMQQSNKSTSTFDSSLGSVSEKSL